MSSTDESLHGAEARARNDRKILAQLRRGPKAINELQKTTDVPLSTLKRRLRALSEGKDRRLRKNADGTWERLPDDIARQEKRENEEWRNRTLDIGGTSYPSIVHHVHNVCIGLVYLAKRCGGDIVPLIPDSHLAHMGHTQLPKEGIKVGPFVDNAIKHLEDAYHDIYQEMNDLEKMRKRSSLDRDTLFADAVRAVKENLTLDDLAMLDWYTPSGKYPHTHQEIDEQKERYFTNMAYDFLIPEARRKLAGRETMLAKLCYYNGITYINSVEWIILCPEGKEGTIVNFIRAKEDHFAARLKVLYELDAEIKVVTEHLCGSIAQIVNGVMENNRLQGSCPSCPVPPFCSM